VLIGSIIDRRSGRAALHRDRRRHGVLLITAPAMAPAEPAEQPSGAFPWNALKLRRLPPPRFGNTLHVQERADE
jgi:hypothetical protein